jgi:Tfp pilus assembly protein PilF
MISITLAASLASGCVTLEQERFRDYNEDGVLMFEHGRYRDARESFQAALKYKPDDPGLLYNIGQCYDREGQYIRAEKAYQDCLKLAANHEPCRNALAAVWVRTGRKADASSMIEGWLTREPGLAGPYALDGWYWRQAGDTTKAQARLQQALEIDPQNVLALTEMGQIYESMQRPDRALALYERARAKAPREAELTNRVNALLTKGAGRPQPE